MVAARHTAWVEDEVQEGLVPTSSGMLGESLRFTVLIVTLNEELEESRRKAELLETCRRQSMQGSFGDAQPPPERRGAIRET